MKARYQIKENVTYQVKDKFGNLKKLFQENWLYRWFLKHNIRLPEIPLIFGYWSNSKVVSNLVVTAGKAGVAARILWDASGHEAPFTYIAVGTGTTAAAAADTALETEIVDSGLARAVADLSQITTDVTNDTAQLTETFSVTGTKAVTESGVLNAAAAGTLLARQVFAAINVVSGDSLIMTWKFDVD